MRSAILARGGGADRRRRPRPAPHRAPAGGGRPRRRGLPRRRRPSRTPQGACTSPALSDRVARRPDRRLGARLGLACTRYADDPNFSNDEAFEGRVGCLMARGRHLAAEEGLAVDEARSRVLRRRRTGRPRAWWSTIARTYQVRRLRAILHRARAEGLEARNREGRPDFLAWLRGKISFIATARPETGALLEEELEALLAH